MISIYNFLLNILEFNYKRRLIKVLKSYLGNNIHTFFDVGAHKGETTILFSNNFKIGSCHLFEPIHDNFEKLNENINKSRKINKCYKNNFALGEENLKTSIKTVFETSSSTLNQINTSTNYFKRKKKILNLFDKNAKIIENEVIVKSAKEYVIENKIDKINLLKIDVEGYEYHILNSLESYLKNIKIILFEHHYDLMIKKKYKFRDINNLLNTNNFKQIYKTKMIFRKSFEYTYLNKDFNE